MEEKNNWLTCLVLGSMRNKLPKIIMTFCIIGIIVIGVSFDLLFMQMLGSMGLAILIGFFLTDRKGERIWNKKK